MKHEASNLTLNRTGIQQLLKQSGYDNAIPEELAAFISGIRHREAFLLAEQKQGETVAQSLKDAVFTVLEGFTLDSNVRKILESAYYTTPQPAQKPWVGLTDDEISEAYNAASKKALYAMGATREDVYEAIEAKLKEKNT